MIRPAAATAFAALALTACEAPAPAGGKAALASVPAAPPETRTDAEGRCWASEPVPAIYEQVPGQVQVVQAEIAEDGTVIRPPIYRNTKVPKVVRPRGEMTFEAPCPALRTPEFLSSVQRALKAREYYHGPITGMIDAPTTAAIERYQTERGLESGKLSLETARALGLVAVEIPDENETAEG